MSQFIYQLSNTVDNAVLVYVVGSTGRLLYVNSVPTGGRGTSLIATDPLFSQHCLVVYQQYLFAVNAGSNSFSMFRIGPDGRVRLLQVVDSYGNYPVTLAINQRLVVVANSGTTSNLQCYRWSPSAPLSPIVPYPIVTRSITLNPTQTTPPHGPLNTVSDVLFGLDNRCIIVIYKSGILIYPISDDDAVSLYPISTVPFGKHLLYGAITVIAQPNWLLVTDASSGVDLLEYDSSGRINRLDHLPIMPRDSAVCWVTYSYRTGIYYVIATDSNQIIGVGVDSISRKLRLVSRYQLLVGTVPSDACTVVVGDTEYLYVNGPGSNTVDVLRICDSGQLVLISTVRQPHEYRTPTVVGMVSFNSLFAS